MLRDKIGKLGKEPEWESESHFSFITDTLDPQASVSWLQK